MRAVPAPVSSEAGTVAEQDVELVHEEASTVVCEPAVHVTEERFVKPVPAILTDRVLLPTPALDGERPISAGAVS
jgi:hypothetical protein